MKMSSARKGDASVRLGDQPRIVELMRHWSEHAEEQRSLVALVGEGVTAGTIEGSGTLLRIAGAPFLLTASHVVTPWLHRGGLRIASASGYISIGAHGIVGRDDDKHDVAVLSLTDAMAARLVADGAHFLSSAHIETVPPRELSTGRCLLFGFPEQRTKREEDRIVHGPQGFICEPASPEHADVLPSTYDPEHHFLLLDRDFATDLETGESERKVQPHGMSGGPLWWVGTEDALGPVERRARSMRWIGIQSSVFSGEGAEPGFLKAVSLRSAAELMCAQWPELRPALALHTFGAVARVPWKPAAT